MGEMRKKGQSRKRSGFCWRQDYGFRDQESRRETRVQQNRPRKSAAPNRSWVPVDSNGYLAERRGKWDSDDRVLGPVWSLLVVRELVNEGFDVWLSSNNGRARYSWSRFMMQCR
jgi:hypothetical protein